MYKHDNKKSDNSQELIDKTLKKLMLKKVNNKKIIDWLLREKEFIKADNISNCATHVGITIHNNVAHIVKSNFCRERLCCVCAWRRQARFLAQMKPVLAYLEQTGYKFIFATITVKNMAYDELETAVDDMMKGFSLLRHRRKIKRSWSGITRSLELTYNQKDKSYHPHIHMLIAVTDDYFETPGKYISQEELTQLWKESMNLDYTPICHIRRVDATDNAAVETLKYALKPTEAEEALKAFHYVLKGRRLISFTGKFAKTQKLFKLGDFENEMNDDNQLPRNTEIEYNLYRFDATGGVYNLYKQLKFYNE